jgi:hypothetical protein
MPYQYITVRTVKFQAKFHNVKCQQPHRRASQRCNGTKMDLTKMRCSVGWIQLAQTVNLVNMEVNLWIIGTESSFSSS